MAISVEEIRKATAPVSPLRRDYFTMEEFQTIVALLPDHHLELADGQLVIHPSSPRDYFSIEDFEIVANELFDHRLELISGEISMMPPPDIEHQKLAGRIISLLAHRITDIEAMGCSIGGSTSWFEVPDSFRKPDGSGPSDICPDSSVYYRNYFGTDRRPPALLIVEVLSFSDSRHIKRDLKLKRAIYATLEVPAYWVVDRRDQSVLAHTEPHKGEYDVCAKFKDDQTLPAPGLDFLRITPEQIFAE